MLPVIDTIEIGNNGRCLVILKSAGNVESLTFSLTTGAFLRRYSTNSQLESRSQAHQSQAVYHIQADREFARDVQYQVRSATHKEPAHTPRSEILRWIQIPTIKGGEDDCTTGSYISSGGQRPQHCVTFVKQGLSFSAFEDEEYDRTNVHWNRLKITTGLLGTETQDSGPIDLVSEYNTDIGKASDAASWWSPSAKTSPPSDCVSTNGDGESVVNYDQWIQARRRWPDTSRLLGDEKALILVLPHQLVVWKFQTLQTWRDRRKHRVKYFAKERVKDVGRGVWLIVCIGVGGPLMIAIGVVVVLPILVCAGLCGNKKKDSAE